MEAKEFLLGIQAQISASAVAGQVSAVQFFPPEYPGTVQAAVSEVPSEETFCEHDHELSNSDIADGAGRGAPTSGFEHRQRGDRPEGWSTLEAMPRTLSNLKELGSEIQVTLEQMDDVPANPGTIRGAIGRWIILILRRLLWWHTRSVSAFADVVTRDLKEQVAFLQHLSKIQEENQRTLLSIQQALTGMGARLEESANQERQLVCRTSRLESDVRIAAELNASLTAKLRRLSISADGLEEKPNRAEVRDSERASGLERREAPKCRHENL
jgi:hypothetical protein